MAAAGSAIERRVATDYFTAIKQAKQLEPFYRECHLVAYKASCFPNIFQSFCDYQISMVSDVSFGRFSRTPLEGYLLDRLLIKSKSNEARSLQLTDTTLCKTAESLLMRFATPDEIREINRALVSNEAEYSSVRP